MKIDKGNSNLKAFPREKNPNGITELLLANNQIASIPPEIKNYQSLHFLQLDHNRIEKLPKEISKLSRLTRLSLVANKLNDLPSSIGGLSKMSLFHLDTNKLKEIPASIGQLSQLTHLYLGNNQLKKLPPEIGDLKKLTHLYLTNNLLTRLPDEICELPNLQHLVLSKNPLKRLPEGFEKLKNLKNLKVDGTRLLLEADWNSLPPNRLITKILEKQGPPTSVLGTKTFSIFRNISSPEFKDQYYENLNDLFSHREIEPKEILKSEEINGQNIVFIICPFDLHINENLIFEVISKCQRENIMFYILMQSSMKEAGGLINLDKGAGINKLRKKLQDKFPSEVVNYTNLEDLVDKVFDGLRTYSPKVVIQELELKNIGHFINHKFKFNKDVTCIIGENGSGKSTILRALSLACIGITSNDLDKEKIKNMLRIREVESGGKLRYNKTGYIRLTYSMDGELKENVINLSVEDGEIEVSESGDFETISKRPILKSLMLGFPQVRGTTVSISDKKSPQSANFADLIPLINNTPDNRLTIFSQWILRLYAIATDKVSKSSKTIKLNDVNEVKLIHKVFEYIVKLTNHKIRFVDVDYTQESPRIIVSTSVSKKVPLELISQGFKVILGWVGYFMQRLMESHPFKRKDFIQENAVLIVDEIDTYIHPKWQIDFLINLNKLFPNTQIISSSHSPLAVLGMDGDKIVDLEIQKAGITVSTDEQTGTRNLDVGTTLLTYFGLNSIVSSELQKKISRYYELLDNGMTKSKEFDLIQTELKSSHIGTVIHDYRYLAFLKYLEENNLDTEPKIKSHNLDLKRIQRLEKEFRKHFE